MGETRICIDCQQEFPFNECGVLVNPNTADAFTSHSRARCPSCHAKLRKNNRTVYPLCPMCGKATRVYHFLHEYRGFRLSTIRVCCTNCIPQFEALPEVEQMERLYQAIVKVYGETAVIYGLQYPEDAAIEAKASLWERCKNSFFCHHIGRTKNLKRRMAEYRRNWYREIKAYHVLEELPFGGLSMERESRWMLHALKYHWPIDNFKLLHLDDDGAGRRSEQEQLAAAVADIEPLTAPFKVVEPLLRSFMNTEEAPLVHWFADQIEVENCKNRHG